MASLVEGLLELYICIIIGFVVGYLLEHKKRRSPVEKVLTWIVLNAVTPILVFTSLVKNAVTIPWENVVSTILVMVSTALVAMGFAYKWLRKKPDMTDAKLGSYLLLAGFANATIFPLPIVLAVFGSDFLIYPILYASASLVLRGTLATYICIKLGGKNSSTDSPGDAGKVKPNVEASKDTIPVANKNNGVDYETLSAKKTARTLLTFPPTVAIVIALAFVLLNIPYPIEFFAVIEIPVAKASSWLGAATIGMILNGINIAKVRELKRDIPRSMLLRFIIPLAFFLPLSFMLPIVKDETIVKTILLFEVLGPPAIINTLFAARFHLDKELVAMNVVVLTLLMLVFTPIILIAGSLLFL